MNNNILINEMGILFENFGVNPIMGRIYGLLLESESPISLIDISETLNLSKAAISIQIRILENLGYCSKLPKTNDRQHYYILNDDYLEDVYRLRIEKELSTINKLEKLLKKKKNISKIGSKRLSLFIDFNNYIIKSQLDSLRHWEEHNDNNK